MRSTMTLTGLPRWFVRYTDDADEKTATIYIPIDGSRMVVEVATIDCLPCENIDGEMELVRTGEDAERLRNVCLIAHAPDLLDVVRRTIQSLKTIVDDETKIPETHHALWVRLCEIQDELEQANDEATDVDTI